MEVIPTEFRDLLVIKPEIFKDDRGYFFESFNQLTWRKAGIQCRFVQDNESQSSYGVVRGLHYQLQPYAQAKLVRVIHGAIFDVAVDLRRNSPTFGRWFGVELTGENKTQLFIPTGFAHGFSVLSEKALVLYKTDDFYKKEAERGIVFNDPRLNIDWRLKSSDIVQSDRDSKLPLLDQAEFNFNYQAV